MHGDKNTPARRYVLGMDEGHRTLNIASINPDDLNDNEKIMDIIIQMRKKGYIYYAYKKHTLIKILIDILRGIDSLIYAEKKLAEVKQLRE